MNRDNYISADNEVRLLAEFVSDVEGLRIAQENRVRSLEAEGVDVDLLWNATNRAGDSLASQLAGLEKQSVARLEKAVKAHPLGDFAKRTKGVGFKQLGRLLSALGDPIWNEAEDRRRRGPAELWKYCGLAPDQRKRKGEKAAWNHEAKMRLYLIAESCIKSVASETAPASPYRDLYDACRLQYAERLHEGECRRCGPSGKPALPGSPLSDGHKHAMAIRRMMKALLKDLYNERKFQLDDEIVTEAPVIYLMADDRELAA